MSVFFDKAMKTIKDPERLKKAQYALDSQIMNDMIPYMPLQTGQFQNLTRMRSAALAGSGVVCAATTVYGRYLYYGKKMKNSETGKGPMRIPLAGGEVIFRFPKGSTLIASNEPLKYSNRQAKPEWYKVAESQRLKEWEKLVKDILTK